MNLDIIESIDADVYGSLKSMFEHLLLRTVAKAQQGDPTYVDDMNELLAQFNNRTDESMRMMQRLRRLEKG